MTGNSGTQWDDYRIAWQVARSGTLSKAGRVLQMNHATVLRHINRLEDALGIKLFIRHQRGYQLTDAGELMVQTFPDIEKRFNQFEDLLTSAEKNISGNLRITTVPDYPPLLNPALKAFRREYPKLRIEMLATDEVLSMAKGEAHVAIRVGPKPNEADLIVKRLTNLAIHYYASDEYVAERGLPESPKDFGKHLWALPSAGKRNIPFVKKVLAHITEEQIIYQSNNFPDIVGVVSEGMAIGPIADYKASANNNLRRIDFLTGSKDECLWFAYHKDLKNSARIQALFKFLSASLAAEKL